jgi:protein-S-isoprenylcysteine O-methyltransferase Ste14
MRIPSLGPRGEGWLGLQVLLMLGILFAAWTSSQSELAGTTGALALRLVGAVGVLVALALVVVASAELRRAAAFSALPRPVEAGSLVNTGPYRYVRHPIYSALILGGFSIALIRLSLLAAALTIALALVLDLKRRREELWLVERFQGYPAYRTRTRALVPFLY